MFIIYKLRLILALLSSITSERLEFSNLHLSTVGVICAAVLAVSSKNLLCASLVFLYVIFLHLFSAKPWVRAHWWCYVTYEKASIYGLLLFPCKRRSLDWQVHWLIGFDVWECCLADGTLVLSKWKEDFVSLDTRQKAGPHALAAFFNWDIQSVIIAFIFWIFMNEDKWKYTLGLMLESVRQKRLSCCITFSFFSPQ